MTHSCIKTALIGLVGLMPALATAAPIVVGGTGSWQPLAAPAPAVETATTFSTGLLPYWNGPSWDSAGPCTAGSMVGGTACDAYVLAEPFSLGMTGNGTTRYWAAADGGADADFYFDAGASATYDITIDAELTAWSQNNELGWYDPFTGEHHLLLSSDMTVGDTVRVELPSIFGFYYFNTTYSQAYYTQSSWNKGGTLGAQHDGYTPGQQFALFNEGSYWWLGLEDLFGPLSATGCSSVGLCSDWDYNDLIVRFQPVSVPEPGMTALLGLGLLGLAWAVRRRTNNEV